MIKLLYFAAKSLKGHIIKREHVNMLHQHRFLTSGPWTPKESVEKVV